MSFFLRLPVYFRGLPISSICFDSDDAKFAAQNELKTLKLDKDGNV